jgi:superfamily II DNA/RNA helicase
MSSTNDGTEDTKYSLPPEDFTGFYKIESTSGKCLVLDEADKMLVRFQKMGKYLEVLPQNDKIFSSPPRSKPKHRLTTTGFRRSVVIEITEETDP